MYFSSQPSAATLSEVVGDWPEAIFLNSNGFQQLEVVSTIYQDQNSSVMDQNKIVTGHKTVKAWTLGF